MIEEPYIAIVLHMPHGQHGWRRGPHRLPCPVPDTRVIIQILPHRRLRVGAVVPLRVHPISYRLPIERGQVEHVHRRRAVGHKVAAVGKFLAVGTVRLDAQHVAVHRIFDEFISAVYQYIAAVERPALVEGGPVHKRVDAGRGLRRAAHLRKAKAVCREMRLADIFVRSLRPTLSFGVHEHVALGKDAILVIGEARRVVLRAGRVGHVPRTAIVKS
mmetsp:Transcript_57764/g.122546  ORF Transcript_57764/g.122546 Transcript_57764/m.122546 type:complete len:216 (-) Transcript_57764:1707-2354(-)